MSKVSEAIFSYTDWIERFEKALMKEYNLKSIPFLNQSIIPRNSSILIDGEIIKFKFHGSGCSLQSEFFDLSYDVYVDRDNYIVTSPWKFMCFINSFFKMSITEQDSANWLISASKENIVNRVFEDYLVYEINIEWYKLLSKMEDE